jgi:hypothetical protein
MAILLQNVKYTQNEANSLLFGPTISVAEIDQLILIDNVIL